ncbi:hypothetical protein M408DRAFT_328103, partial [Serendipita vermifera MAFF 305830]
AGGVEAEGGTDSILPDSAFSGLATFALAGLLSGMGSKLQNGCTSGHMICGISRFSRRSFIATAAFFGVASITAQLHRQTLHSVKGYDWTLGSTGLSILQTQGALFGALIILLIIFSRTNIERSSGRYRGLFDGSITLLRLPILGNDTWPDGLNQTIDARLIGGAVIFGVGWGILGLCPGPALVNFGISLYALGRGKIEDDLLRGGIWLATFVVGGLVVS